MDNMSTKNNIFIRLFVIALGIFMFLLAANFFITQQTEKSIFYNCVYTIIILVMIIVYGIKGKTNSLKNPIYIYVSLFGIVAVGVVLRIISIYFFQTIQISDFSNPAKFFEYYQENGSYIETGWENKDLYQLYYTRLPAWYAYMRVTNLLFSIFGCNNMVIQVMNLILAALTIITIYYVMLKISDYQTAILASALFAFDPSLIMYTNAASPEHIAILLIPVILSVWISYETCRVTQCSHKKKLAYIVVLGILLTLLNYFKPIAIVCIIALVCYEFSTYFLNVFAQKISWKERWGHTFKYQIISIILLVLITSAGNWALNQNISSFFKTDVVDNTYFMLYTGLAVDENIQYDFNYSAERLSELLKEYNNNQQVAMEKLTEEAKVIIRQNLKYLPNIFIQKLEILNSEYAYFGAANTSPDENYRNSIVKVLQMPILTGCMAYMRILFILTGIGTLIILVKKELNRILFFSSIVLFGYMSLLIISATQGRYKSIVIPIFCILSAYCIKELSDKSKTVFLKYIKKENKI